MTLVPPSSFRWKNVNTGGNIASGIGAASAIAGAFTPNTYDPRVGMEKPNAMKQFTDLQMTGMGASFGPIGMGVGFAADMAKNAIAYQKAKKQYETAENKAEYYDDRANRLATMQPDYTGYARYGAARYGQVIAENGETLYTEDKDDYKAQPINGLTHEEGGVKMSMPPNSVVAPQEYAANMNHNMDKKENMEQLKFRMNAEGKKASLLGLPYAGFRTARYGEDNTNTPTDATITPNAQPTQVTTTNLQALPTQPPPTTDGIDLQQASRQEPPNKQPMAAPSTNGKTMREQTRNEALRLGLYYDKNGAPATYWDERSQTRRFKADNTIFDPTKAQPRVEQEPAKTTTSKSTTAAKPATSTQETTATTTATPPQDTVKPQMQVAKSDVRAEFKAAQELENQNIAQSVFNAFRNRIPKTNTSQSKANTKATKEQEVEFSNHKNPRMFDFFSKMAGTKMQHGSAFVPISKLLGGADSGFENEPKPKY